MFPRRFSDDTYLCGSLASETVHGIQAQGVIASTKMPYTLVHDTYGCQNSKTLKGLLKIELGSDRFMVRLGCSTFRISRIFRWHYQVRTKYEVPGLPLK
ncbi:hypothetical protein BCON_0083g00270 [Botryotinia convoluta]|uniref:Uncharacterized protein n=1 Tax=Botryotinia convoluta TaxID=54673 RepID=A0A4Z1IH25_9HELO|nr:hypothetical protein BCON_0083g00270 [Botryotinia convoluta]